MTNQDLIIENDRLVSVINITELHNQALGARYSTLKNQYERTLTDSASIQLKLDDALNDLALSNAELNNLRAWRDAALKEVAEAADILH